MSTTGANATLFMLAVEAADEAADVPLYYDCGLAMNTAWGAMARDPCSMSTWTASDKMKKMVPECSKLRQGEKYMASYQALKLDQDTWCGPPQCSPACMKGVKCFRNLDAFPFEPQCERYPTTSTKKPHQSEAYTSRDTAKFISLLALSAWCMPSV